MIMNRYTQGRREEYRIRDIFRNNGYYVTRSAGSKGIFDLIILGQNTGYAIQIKKGSNITRKELEKFLDTKVCLHKVIWYRKKNYEKVSYYK